jgi:hypothetical protein
MKTEFHFTTFFSHFFQYFSQEIFKNLASTHCMPKLNINYLSDTKGNTTAVLLPIQVWKQFIGDYNKLNQYARMKNSLSEAFREVQEIEQGKRKAIPFLEFLNEL